MLERLLIAIGESSYQKASSELQPTAHRVHFLKTSWFRYAAAVLLLAGGATIWYAQSHKSGEQLVQAKDILPGTNRAILTIGNNNKIDLASNKTGITVGHSITYTDGEKIAEAGQRLQLTTPPGGQYQAVLPDGSKVWLNAASSISFPSKFDGKERSVDVTGEVYLEVAKNSKQTFVVNANGAQIQVLGTSFDINTYKDEDAVKMTLIEGRVKVKTDKAETLVKPGEQAQISQQQLKVVVAADIEKIMAWKNGLFNFEGTHLKELMRQLQRWYNIEVVYEKQVPDIEFVGKISRNVPLSDLLAGLEGVGVHFRLEEGRRLVVLP
jgi:hypothetical protein